MNRTDLHNQQNSKIDSQDKAKDQKSNDFGFYKNNIKILVKKIPNLELYTWPNYEFNVKVELDIYRHKVIKNLLSMHPFLRSY